MDRPFDPSQLATEPWPFNRKFMMCILGELEHNHDESVAAQGGAEAWIIRTSRMALAAFTGLGEPLFDFSFDQALRLADFSWLEDRVSLGDQAPALLSYMEPEANAEPQEDRKRRAEEHIYLMAILNGRSEKLHALFELARSFEEEFPNLPDPCLHAPSHELFELLGRLREREILVDSLGPLPAKRAARGDDEEARRL